jgi:25S rRNA (uracil2634-N3)-methyltransferase
MSRADGRKGMQGKGITDQDRNILSNQVLILGFLRSAARFLVRGPMPQLQPSGKGKHSPDDDEDGYSDEDHNEVVGISGRARGTVLITLRNAPPYTEWFACQRCSQWLPTDVVIYFRDVPKLAKNPPPPHSSTGLPNPQYILFRSFVFYRSDWRGYEHRMTKGERAHGHGKTGGGGEDRTWEFYLKDE